VSLTGPGFSPRHAPGAHEPTNRDKERVGCSFRLCALLFFFALSRRSREFLQWVRNRRAEITVSAIGARAGSVGRIFPGIRPHASRVEAWGGLPAIGVRNDPDYKEEIVADSPDAASCRAVTGCSITAIGKLVGELSTRTKTRRPIAEIAPNQTATPSMSDLPVQQATHERHTPAVRSISAAKGYELARRGTFFAERHRECAWVRRRQHRVGAHEGRSLRSAWNPRAGRLCWPRSSWRTAKRSAPRAIRTTRSTASATRISSIRVTGYPVPGVQSVTVLVSRQRGAGALSDAALQADLIGGGRWKEAAASMGVSCAMLVDADGVVHITGS